MMVGRVIGGCERVEHARDFHLLCAILGIACILRQRAAGKNTAYGGRNLPAIALQRRYQGETERPARVVMVAEAQNRNGRAEAARQDRCTARPAQYRWHSRQCRSSNTMPRTDHWKGEATTDWLRRGHLAEWFRDTAAPHERIGELNPHRVNRCILPLRTSGDVEKEYSAMASRRPDHGSVQDRNWRVAVTPATSRASGRGPSWG